MLLRLSRRSEAAAVAALLISGEVTAAAADIGWPVSTGASVAPKAVPLQASDERMTDQ